MKRKTQLEITSQQQAKRFKGLYNLFSNNYDADLESFRRSAELRLQFTEEGSAAEKEIHAQLDEFQTNLRNKQARDEKTINLFSAIINTAAAVTSALKDSIPLAIAVGLLGAAENSIYSLAASTSVF